MNTKNITTRRKILKNSILGSAAFSYPNLLAANKSDSSKIIGDGEYQYEVEHNWVNLPDKYTWQTTHNVSVDSKGYLYVIHEGLSSLIDHPSIFVFDQ